MIVWVDWTLITNTVTLLARQSPPRKHRRSRLRCSKVIRTTDLKTQSLPKEMADTCRVQNTGFIQMFPKLPKSQSLSRQPRGGGGEIFGADSTEHTPNSTSTKKKPQPKTPNAPQLNTSPQNAQQNHSMTGKPYKNVASSNTREQQ